VKSAVSLVSNSFLWSSSLHCRAARHHRWYQTSSFSA